MPHSSLRIVTACLALIVASFANPTIGAAQTDGHDASPLHKASKTTKPLRDKYGSPLDTLMSTHLWTDVPAAQDFVTQTRPDTKGLAYQPLTGTDPDRPKPRDAANIQALQAELQSDGVKNERKARVLRPAVKRKPQPPKPVSAKP